MRNLLWDKAFRRLLILLILLLFAMLLLYTDYLQEMNFYQNKLQLSEFQVNFETYKLLQESSMLNQIQMKNIDIKLKNEMSTKEEKDKSLSVKNKEENKLESTIVVLKDDTGETDMDSMQHFSLELPFPEIDLTSIGPVFLENGLIHLYFEYSFDTIRCTVGGRIPAEKIYFPTAYFTNPHFENIIISFGWREFIRCFSFYRSEKPNGIKKDNKDINHNKLTNNYIGWIDHQVLKSNIPNIELFTNYIMLFGSNGTNLNLFHNPEESAINEGADSHNSNLAISKKYKYYTFIHTQVCVLFILIYLKLVNFILFASTLSFQFGLHIPIYFFNRFKYGKFDDNSTENMDLTGFDEWIKNNEVVEQMLLDNRQSLINITDLKRNFSNPHNSELRLRKISTESPLTSQLNEGFSSGVQETESMRIQDIWKLFEVKEKKPLTPLVTPELYSGLFSPYPMDHFEYDIENQNQNQNQITQFRETESTLISESNPMQEYLISSSSLNELVDKYYLFYLSTCFFLLFHLIIYEIINMILYNMISNIFEVIRTSDPNHLNTQNTSIFQVPKVLVNSVTVTSSHNKSILTQGNQILDDLLNIMGYLMNVFLALIFHGIYVFCIYTYTISIY